jgi:chaperone modulatory protein CbpM
MIGERELVDMVERLEADALRQWVVLGWIAPGTSDAGFTFDEVDVARVQLICDLRYDLEVEVQSVSIILSLIDQLHDTRRKLRAFAAAVEEQPEDVRKRFAARLRAMLDRGR